MVLRFVIARGPAKIIDTGCGGGMVSAPRLGGMGICYVLRLVSRRGVSISRVHSAVKRGN